MTVTAVPWIEDLARILKPAYTQPSVPGGHDYLHVTRMIALGSRIGEFIDFDLDEFAAAVWLHNLDRTSSFDSQIKKLGEDWFRQNPGYFGNAVYDEEDVHAVIRDRGFIRLCAELLADSPFDDDARARIIDAVLRHAKKDDEPEDSTLLMALRIADKIDALGSMRALMIAAHAGSNFLLYDPEKPFGYSSTAEGRMKTVYAHFFRVLEWYGMLPCDAARSLVNPRNFGYFVNFIRQFGEEIAEATGKPNEVEGDIGRALGPYYEMWK